MFSYQILAYIRVIGDKIEIFTITSHNNNYYEIQRYVMKFYVTNTAITNTQHFGLYTDYGIIVDCQLFDYRKSTEFQLFADGHEAFPICPIKQNDFAYSCNP